MQALGRVVSNKGSAGMDGMPVKDLYAYLTANRERIEPELRLGKYQPQPILGVEIPRKNGKTRDEVDHSILLQILYRKVKCPLTLRLIRKWLRVPIWKDGKFAKRRKGVPQ